MWGAILGDIAGSRFEWNRIKTKDFEFFGPQCEYTDDSVCTAAVADILLHDLPAAPTLQQWCRRHPGRGYGGMFANWIETDDPAPYGSFGERSRDAGFARCVLAPPRCHRGRSQRG